MRSKRDWTSLFESQLIFRGIGSSIAVSVQVQQALYRRKVFNSIFFNPGALILIKPIIGSIKSGRLQRSLWHAADLVFANIREHVVEPLQDLVTNLFDTLKHRDPIVTQEELVQDHLALIRMLEEYSAKKQADRNGNMAIIHEKIYGPQTSDAINSAPPQQTSILDGAPKRSLENKLMTSSHLRSMDV